MKGILHPIFFIWLSLNSSLALAKAQFALSLPAAESASLESSNQLKALSASVFAADEHALAQESGLYPRLTLDGMYTYNTHVPSVQLPIPGVPALQFGSNTLYSFGPTLTYTLWDSGAVRDSSKGFELLAKARREEKKNSQLSLLLAVRLTYLRLQLNLEELRLLSNSLKLSQAQNHDIEINHRAGAATKLDLVDSERDVINIRLQFAQKQAEVAAGLVDLLAETQIRVDEPIRAPGPPGIDGVEYEVRLDTLDSNLAAVETLRFHSPSGEEPSLKSQTLMAESSERLAQSQHAALYPTLKLSASALIEYPDQLNLSQTEQNSFMAVISMPLYEGSGTSHLTEEMRKQAQMAKYNEQNLKIGLERDYQKAIELLASLREQKKLATLDVQRSADAAHLYYQSYKGGKLNLIDVQSANNRALLAQVNAARINAQILTQIYTLQSISGEAQYKEAANGI